MSDKADSTIKTVMVALLLCIVCSVMVAGTVQFLKPRIVTNKDLDVKKNILIAAGYIDAEKSVTAEEIESLFKSIEIKLINIKTGGYDTSVKDVAKYDARKESKKPGSSIAIQGGKDIAKVRSVAPFKPVYLVKKDDVVEKYIFPVHGKGLWSTMYGFLALSSDFETVKGITFYEHGETPGLGGEVDNKEWKKSWKGKKLFKDSEVGLPQVGLKVIKGTAKGEYQIDGLSGATLTSRGVDNLIQFWFGDEMYGKYIAKVKGTNNKTNNKKDGN